MAKIATDIFQSKKLAEILPIESADMYYMLMPDDKYNTFPLTGRKTELAEDTDIPCWSLAALLGVLPNGIGLFKTVDGEFYCLSNDYMTKNYHNPVDACYEMIIKLYELNLL